MPTILDPFSGLRNPPLGIDREYSIPMTGKKPKVRGLAKAVFAQNVKHLLEKHYPNSRNRPRSLADDAGISLSSVQRALSGETAPTLDTLEAIAGVFKVTFSQLLEPGFGNSEKIEAPIWRTGTI